MFKEVLLDYQIEWKVKVREKGQLSNESILKKLTKLDLDLIEEVAQKGSRQINMKIYL